MFRTSDIADVAEGERVERPRHEQGGSASSAGPQIGLALDFGSNTPVADQVDRAAEILSVASGSEVDSVWVGESFHAQPAAFHLPSPLTMLAHLSASTDLKLGTGVLVLRGYNTRQLAYEVALVDQLSRGRLILGLGLGERWVSLRLGLGPLPPGFFDDALELLKGAFAVRSEAVDRWQMSVPTYKPGGPPILVGGQGERAVKRAAVAADGYFAATHYSDALLEVRTRQYRDLLAGADGAVCVTRVCIIRDTHAHAVAASRYFDPIIAAYNGNNHWGIGLDGTADPNHGSTLIGTAADVAEQLAVYGDWGVSRVNLRLAPLGMPLEEAKETVRRIRDMTQYPRPESDLAPASPGRCRSHHWTSSKG